MSNEIQRRGQLQIIKRDTTGTILLIDYRPQDTFFTATMSGFKGPTPGSIVASEAGTDVDLSQLTAFGGWCRIKNADPTNYITIGIMDLDTGKFHPFHELLPGEFYEFRISRFFQSELTGTGTLAFDVQDRLHIKGAVANCNVVVDAFDP